MHTQRVGDSAMSIRRYCLLQSESPRLCLGLVAVVLSVPGCATKLKPIFDEPDSPIVWPEPPKPARIRYVGQLRSSADLKPPRKPFERLGELLFGREPAAPLYGPRALVRSGDRLWIADPGGRCLHQFDLKRRSYKKITHAGPTPLLAPVGLCLGPLESIYVCDSEGGAVHRLSVQTGDLIESLHLPEDVLRPVAIAYTEPEEELYLVDARAHDIKVLSIDGSLRRIIGRRGERAGEFNFPSAIVADKEILWIVDTGNHRVQGLKRDGTPVIALGQPGDAPGDLALPKGIALDSDGNIYVLDARFENIQIFDPTGGLLLFFGEEGTGPGEFWLPGGLFIDANDRVWVCDAYNGRIQVFDYVKMADDEEARHSERNGVDKDNRVPE